MVARLHRCGGCQGDLFRDFAFNGTMATWRSSIRWKSTASSDDEVESDFDEDALDDTRDWRRQMYSKTRRRSSVRPYSHIADRKSKTGRGRKHSGEDNDIKYYRKAVDRDRDNASPPSWKSHKPKPQRRRSSVRSQGHGKHRDRKPFATHSRGSNARRRPSYLIESERIKESVAEVDEEELIRKTIGRIPSILEEDFSSQRSRSTSGGSSFRQRLRSRAKEKERRKQREKILEKNKAMQRDISNSLTELMTVNDLQHFSTARFDTIITCCKYSRGFPNMANPTRLEVYDIFKSDKYSSEGAEEIADALLENNAGLRRLEFRDCYFNDADCAKLMKAIRKNNTIKLKTLRFDGNTVGNEAAEQIAIWLENATGATTLGLSRTSLTFTGVKLIARAIEMNAIKLRKSFEIMELDEKDDLSDDAIDLLLDSLDAVDADLKIISRKRRRRV